MSGEDFLDFVERLAAEIRRLEKLVLSALNKVADEVDALSLEAVGRTNGEFEVVDRTKKDRIEGRRIVGRVLSLLTFDIGWMEPKTAS